MLEDYASMIQGGMSLVPDLAQEQLRNRLVTMQEQEMAMQQEAHQTAQAKAAFDLSQARRGAENEMAYLADARQVFSDPTTDNIASLQARYPAYTKAIQSAWEMRDQGARNADIHSLSSIYRLIRLGEMPRAAEMARERYEAEKRAGTADDSDLAIVQALEGGDPSDMEHIGSAILLELAGAVGPDKIGSTFSDLSEEERMRDLHWLKVDREESEAATAAAEAAAAPRYYGSRADIQASDARFRDRRNAASVAGTEARTARTRALPIDGGGKGGGKPAPRPTYVKYGRGPNGERWGFNAKSRKWEPVK